MTKYAGASLEMKNPSKMLKFNQTVYEKPILIRVKHADREDFDL